MAEPYYNPSMADYLQGRVPTPESARQPHGPYTAPMAVSEFTTPGDLQRERISNAFGWDVGPVGWDPWYAAKEFGRRALTQLPLAMRAGGPGVSAMATRAPMTAPVPEGPWSSPGYMQRWLQNRYQPEARPPTWQPDRRWGNVVRDEGREPITWGSVIRGDMRFPQTGREAWEVAKGTGAAAAAGGVGGGIGKAVSDVYLGVPWQDATWDALTWPGAKKPDWWPQPAPNGPQSNGPQPPSMNRTGW